MVETHIETVEEFIVTYSGTDSSLNLDASAFYHPYIPLTTISIPTKDIKQNGLSFSFFTLFQEEIMSWLKSDCRWKFKKEWNGCKVHVTFEEAKGAIEFKLRFC